METVNVKELLSYIVSHLVSDQDAVRIETVEAGDTVTLQLRVAPDDMGKVIGRQGRIAKEIRTLIKSAGQREDKKIMVDILD